VNESFALIIGILLNIALKEPQNKYHPVAYIGNIINYFKKFFYKKSILHGGIFYFFIQSIFFIILYLLLIITDFNLLFETFIYFSFISTSSMREHALSIYKSLKNDNKTSKEKLKMIVSRDVENMDNKKIISSAIESIGENFNDAFFAPFFYTILFGHYGLLFYKITNTLDAMIGYKNEQYEKFGKISAKMDDLLNFIPSRIQLFIIIPVTQILFNNAKSSFMTFFNYRLSLTSPNSGSGISLFAGALNITLGGDTYYNGNNLKKPFIIGGNENLTDEKILDAILLYISSSIFTIILYIVFVGIF
jgi:adenosylcobinamide-phosphate synthase